MSRQPDQIKDGRPPFILIEEAVLRNHKLTAYQIAAYVTLVMFANHKNGDKAFPSHKTIGLVGGMSARQAKRAVDALAEMKLISIEPNHDTKTGAQTSNVYTILPVTTPRLSVIGGLSDSRGAPDSESHKPDESNQMKEKIAANAASPLEKPKPKPTKKDKPADPDNEAIKELIHAWKVASGAIDPAAFGKKVYRDSAREMHHRGITPEDVTVFTTLKTNNDPFWKGKSIPFSTIAKDISAWKAVHVKSPDDTNPSSFGASNWNNDFWDTFDGKVGA